MEEIKTLEFEPVKGHYETLKEYTKEVPVYDESGKQIGTETFVTGRDRKWVWDDPKEIKNELRRRRETECFSIINRGQLWHDSLTEEQKTELKAWYVAWLNVTETIEVPIKPVWIK